jgi:sigma-B regulation protein RsbU (phosphoserine phosphatase)
MLNLDRIKTNLLVKKTNLMAWLASADEVEVRTHAGEAGLSAIDQHVAHLDAAIQKAEEGTLGMCTVCHGVVDTPLLEMDYTACICLSHLPESEMRQLERELELASIVQRSFFPQTLPSIPGLEMAAYSQPAQIVGGDYFDVLHFADGAHGLVIADVAGHGVSSGLHMASVQTALRTLVPLCETPVEVLGRINRLYSHNINFTSFVTLFMGKFETGGYFTYSNAGHNPPLLFRRNRDGGEHHWLEPTGAAIGLVEDIGLRSQRARLEPGDVLLLYTDGVTEAMSPAREQFGVEGLARAVQRTAGLSSRDLVQALRQDLQAFTAGQPPADDTTIFACRILTVP